MTIRRKVITLRQKIAAVTAMPQSVSIMLCGKSCYRAEAALTGLEPVKSGISNGGRLLGRFVAGQGLLDRAPANLADGLRYHVAVLGKPVGQEIELRARQSQLLGRHGHHGVTELGKRRAQFIELGVYLRQSAFRILGSRG